MPDDFDSLLASVRSGKTTKPRRREADEIDDILKGPHGEKVRKFFGAVKWAEGGQPDLIVGGKQRFDIKGDHPNIVGLRTAEGPSTAAGDYQITGSNWYGNKKKGVAGLKDRIRATDFGPENQLRGAIALFRDRDKGRGLQALLDDDYDTALAVARKDWAALPGSKLHKGRNKTRSYDDFMLRARGTTGRGEFENMLAEVRKNPQTDPTSEFDKMLAEVRSGGQSSPTQPNPVAPVDPQTAFQAPASQAPPKTDDWFFGDASRPTPIPNHVGPPVQAKPTPLQQQPRSEQEEPLMAEDDPNGIAGEIRYSPMPVGKDPEEWAKDDIATALQTQYEIPFQIGKAWVNKYGIGSNPKDGAVRNLSPEEIAANVQVGAPFYLTNANLEELGLMTADWKDRTSRADAEFEETKKRIDPALDPGERSLAEFQARGQADVNAGLRDKAEFDKAYTREKEALDAWNNDRGMLGLFNRKEWTRLMPSTTFAADPSMGPRQPIGVSQQEVEQFNTEERKASLETDRQAAIKQYGSLGNWYQAQKEFAERYRDKPMLFLAKSAESAAGGAIKAVPQTISSGLKTISIAAEAIDKALGVNDAAATERGFYQLGKELDQITEEFIRVDKDFKGGNAELFGNVFGQVATQIATGGLSRGAALPTLLASSLGAAEQYEQATEAGATGWSRLGAAGVGGVLAASDYLIFRNWFGSAGGVEKANFFNNLKESVRQGLISKGLMKADADRVAVQVADGFIAGKFLKEGGKEALQEISESKGNDLYAYLTYDPSPERLRKLTTLTGENIVEGVAGFFGGMVGATYQQIAERATGLTEDAKAQAGDFLDDLAGELPPVTYEAAKQALTDAPKKQTAVGFPQTAAPVENSGNINETPEIPHIPSDVGENLGNSNIPEQGIKFNGALNRGAEPENLDQYLNQIRAQTSNEETTVSESEPQLGQEPLAADQLVKDQNDIPISEPVSGAGDITATPTAEEVSAAAPTNLAQPKPMTPIRQRAALAAKDLLPPRVGAVTTEGTLVSSETKPTGVAKLREMRDVERRKAETDPLTGVANRRALDRALPSAEADANTSVIAFDANNFGQINKKVGESEGDKVLKEMATALDAAAKENGGRVFRKGGDEFTILAPKEKAEAIRAKAEEIFGDREYDGFTVSVSGVAGATFADADSRLQAAKAERKGAAAFKAHTLDIAPQVSSILRRKKQTVRRLAKKGYEFAWLGKNKVKVTAAPKGANAGDFASEVVNTEAERVAQRKPSQRSSKPGKNLSAWKRAVQMGGIKPHRADSGEMRRLSGKESGKVGLISKNGRSAEDMAGQLWEEGYFRDRWETMQDVSGDELIDLLEDDMRSPSGKHFLPEAYEELEKSIEEQEAEFRAFTEEAIRREEETLAKQAKMLQDEMVVSLLREIEEQSDATDEQRDQLETFLHQYGLPHFYASGIIAEFRESEKTVREAESAAEAGELSVEGEPTGAEESSIFGDAYEPEGEVDLSFNPEEFEAGESPLRSVPSTDTDSKVFSNYVDRFIKGELDDAPFAGRVLSATPDVYQLLGAKNLPIAIQYQAIKKILRDKHVEDISPEIVKRVPQAIMNPVAVADYVDPQSGKKGWDILTALEDEKGRPVIVGLRPNQKMGRHDVHLVPTVHSKLAPNATFRRWGKDGSFRFIDTKLAQEISTTYGVFASVVQESLKANPNILTEQDIVNQNSPNDPSILRKTRTLEGVGELEELAKSSDFATLIPQVKSSAEGNTVTLETPEAAEAVRTLLAIAEGTNRDAQPVLEGLFIEPKTVTDLIEAAEAFADEAKASGVRDSPLRDLAKTLEAAAKGSGAVKLKVFDEALPHEEVHEASWLAPARKALADRYAGLKELAAASKSFAKAFKGWTGLEKRNWSIDRATPHQLGHAAEEMFAYISDGQADRIGLTDDEGDALGVELGLAYAEARIAENSELTVASALAGFKGTVAERFIERVDNYEQSRKQGKSDDGDVAGPRARSDTGREGRDAGDEGPDAGGVQDRSDRAAEQPRGDDGRFVPTGEERVSRTSQTLERNNIPVGLRTYTSVTNEDQQAFADQQLDKGADAANAWFSEQVKDNNLNSGATTVVAINLMQHYARVGDIAALNRVGDGMVPMITEAAQAVQAMAILSMYSPETAGAYVTKVVKQKTGKDITKEQVDKAVEIATAMSENVQIGGVTQAALDKAEARLKDVIAEKSELDKALATAKDASKKLKVDLASARGTITRMKNARAKQPKPRTSKAVKEKVQAISARREDILAAIRAKFGEAAVLRMVAWHGSPHTFDKFDISKIGTGEGAQSYGYGLYFADKEAVADYYKRSLAEKKVLYKGEDVSHNPELRQAVETIHYLGGKQAAIAKIKAAQEWLKENPDFPGVDLDAVMSYVKQIKKSDISLGSKGAKYKVNLKPAEDEYLLWDKPLTAQSEKVKTTLKRSGLLKEVRDARSDYSMSMAFRSKKPTGDLLYRLLTETRGSQAEASAHLKSLGIRGIKYLDGTSRGKGEGSFNYVIFDDADVEIAEILRSVPPSTIDQDLIDWSVLHLSANLGKVTPDEFKTALGNLTNGKLTPADIDAIHAAAVSELQSGIQLTPEQKAANKNRLAHFAAARKFYTDQISDFHKSLDKVPDRLTTNIINEGIRNDYSDEAIWFALARKTHPNETDAIKALRKEFPGMDKSAERRVMTDANRLYAEAKTALRDAAIQAKNRWDLTQEDVDLIKEERRVNLRERTKVAREANRFYDSLSKSTFEVGLDTAVNARRANLLSGFKTHGVNVTGNTVFNAAEEVSQVPASMIDVALAAVTGERTVGFLNPNAVWKSFRALVKQDEAMKAAEALDPSKPRRSGIDTAYEYLRYGGSHADLERLQHSESVLGEKFPKMKWMDHYINGVYRTLGAEDALFKVYAFSRSLREQAKMLAVSEHRADKSVDVKARTRELLKQPTNEMIARADKWAEVATFQNNNKLSEWVAKVKRMHPLLKAGIETIMPYDKTPTNIVLRTLEYTPGVGLVIAGKKGLNMRKGLSSTGGQLHQQRVTEFRNRYTGPIRQDVEMKYADLSDAEKRRLAEKSLNRAFTRQQQEEFSRTFGRASFGSGLFALGFFLAAAKLLAGSVSPEDDDRQETEEFFKRRKLGIENRSLLIPGVGRFVLPKSPPTDIIAAGATFFEQMQEGPDALTKLMSAGGEVFEDIVVQQPLIGNMADLYRTLFKKSSFGTFVGSVLGGYVPTLVSDIGEVIDEKPRASSGYRKEDGPRSKFTMEKKLAFQGRGFRNSFLRRVPFARTYADESTTTVSAEERGNMTRRLVRMFDLFNTRSPIEHDAKKDIMPAGEFIKTSNFKGMSTNDIVEMIKMDRSDGRDTTVFEEALLKKARNAKKSGTLTQEEVDKIKEVLPDADISARVKARKEELERKDADERYKSRYRAR